MVAIGLLLQELLDRFDTCVDKPFRVAIFTDSLYASSAIKSSKVPLAHSSLVLSLRTLFARVSTRFTVSVFWIRGHCGAGGNERVDRVAKRFAMLSAGATRCLLPASFRGVKSIRHFPFELSTAPLCAFLMQLPTASYPDNCGSVTESKSSVPDSTVPVRYLHTASLSPTTVRVGTPFVSIEPPEHNLTSFVNVGLHLSNFSVPDNWEGASESKSNVSRHVEPSITLSVRAPAVLVSLHTSTRTRVQLSISSAPVNWGMIKESQVTLPSFYVPVHTVSINVSTSGSHVTSLCTLFLDACKTLPFVTEDDGLDHKHSD